MKNEFKDITDDQRIVLKLMGYGFDKETPGQWARVYQFDKYIKTVAMYKHGEWLFFDNTPLELQAYIKTHVR